ncbi:glucose-1-phosphate adenylyltransferase subunit GlgD [Pseudoflavonifractor phocaeensis]|uniref:glucose-1-phosphate adenylyltransferase subunit GlgD n=1 Tax=Pseudoflavonifractor phocaeensis TaxID=1870988 RepID=UPI00313EB244
MKDLHGIIFAYRQSPDLRELAQKRNACSIPYGGRYRLVDFALSNLVNAGVDDVGIIVHTSYQSLLDHVGSGKDWDLSRKHGGLRILPPFSFSGKHQSGHYRGRMDALAGVYSYLQNIRQDYVLLTTGDLAANLPIAEIFAQHLSSGADITAVCAPVSQADPRMTNYFTLDGEGRVTDIAVNPPAHNGDASLETYILSKSLLLSLVDQCAAHDVASFSQGVLLSTRGRVDLRAYRFDGYAARVLSVAGYFQRSMELLDPTVRASLFNPDRPVKTKDQSNPSTYYGPDARSVNSLISDGCVIEGTVENSILSRGVRVEKGARVENCILMQRTTIQQGAVLRYAITDKNVRVCQSRMLMGHGTYPLVIAKNEIV